MPINLIPVLIGGGIFVYASRKSKNRRKKAKTNIKEQKALPESEDKNAPKVTLGNIYNGKDVDVIEATVGEEFAIELPSQPASGFAWSLEASPPDNSIEFVVVEYGESPAPADGEAGGSSGPEYHKFKAIKPGSGSLVFHLQQPWMKGKQPPVDIVEVETKIS